MFSRVPEMIEFDTSSDEIRPGTRAESYDVRQNLLVTFMCGFEESSFQRVKSMEL